MFLANKARATQIRSYGELTWGWPSHWHAGRLDGHSAAQTLWERATRASPTGRRRDRGAGRVRREEDRREREKNYGSFVVSLSLIVMHEVSNLRWQL